MSAHGRIEYGDAAPEVRAVFDDIKRTRQVEDVNNFWKYLAHDPATLTHHMNEMACKRRGRQ